MKCFKTLAATALPKTFRRASTGPLLAVVVLPQLGRRSPARCDSRSQKKVDGVSRVLKTPSVSQAARGRPGKINSLDVHPRNGPRHDQPLDLRRPLEDGEDL